MANTFWNKKKINIACFAITCLCSFMVASSVIFYPRIALIWQSVSQALIFPVSHYSAPQASSNHEKTDKAYLHMLLIQNRLLKNHISQLENMPTIQAMLKHFPKQFSPKGYHYVFCRKLSVYQGDESDIIYIDVNKNDGIKKGFVVLNKDGIVGYVDNVSDMMSRVTLVGSVKSAIPVWFGKDHKHGILLNDQGSHHMHLIGIEDQNQVKVGDQLLTSGLANRYPAGYPVARIQKVYIHKQNIMAVAKPNIRLADLGQMLVLSIKK
jgi:rod shape-determining protein MreC